MLIGIYLKKQEITEIVFIKYRAQRILLRENFQIYIFCKKRYKKISRGLGKVRITPFYRLQFLIARMFIRHQVYVYYQNRAITNINCYSQLNLIVKNEFNYS